MRRQSNKRPESIRNILQRIEQKINVLGNQVLAGRRDDHIRAIGEYEMSKETQDAINELKAEVAPMSDAVQAVVATIDGMVAQMEEAGDDPEEIREVIASFKSNRDALAAAALKGTSADPVFNPSGNAPE